MYYKDKVAPIPTKTENAAEKDPAAAYFETDPGESAKVTVVLYWNAPFAMDKKIGESPGAASSDDTWNTTPC